MQGKFAGKLNARHKPQDKRVVYLILQRAPTAPLSLFAASDILSGGLTGLFHLLDHEPTKHTTAQETVLFCQDKEENQFRMFLQYTDTVNVN